MKKIIIGYNQERLTKRRLAAIMEMGYTEDKFPLECEVRNTTDDDGNFLIKGAGCMTISQYWFVFKET